MIDLETLEAYFPGLRWEFHGSNAATADLEIPDVGNCRISVQAATVQWGLPSYYAAIYCTWPWSFSLNEGIPAPSLEQALESLKRKLRFFAGVYAAIDGGM